jgi:hypothetical protein
MLVKSVFHFLLNLLESWSEDFQDNGCVRFGMGGGMFKNGMMREVFGV